MDRVIVWLDILVGWIQVDLFFMQVQKSHMKPIFSLSWVELMSLGLICLVIVNYCHSSSYSQLIFFFFPLHVSGSFHSRCHHSSLPISSSRHQPFYTYGIHMLWEKEKRTKRNNLYRMIDIVQLSLLYVPVTVFFTTYNR